MGTNDSAAAAKKKFASGTLWTAAAALLLNGVLQLFIYPCLAGELGASDYGTVLYVMALVGVLGPSLGQAMNNSRLVLRRDYPVTNGDYNMILLLFSAVGIAVCLAFSARTSPGTISGSLFGQGTASEAVLLSALLMLFTIFRYYGDVEYRLTLKYRGYFLYYAVCTAGYAAGYGIYRITGNWIIIFIAGELACLVYLAVTGSVFRKFSARSSCTGIVLRRGAILVISYLVTNLTLNIDRIYLRHAVGGEAVTLYYVSSLIGKTLVLFIGPVNTVMISSLTQKRVSVSRKRFLRFAGLGTAASAAFLALCVIGTPLFIRIFYPALDGRCSLGFIAVVSATQILSMFSAYLFIIVLTFTGEKWQLVLQAAHLALVIAMISLMTPSGGLMGFSAGVLIANAVRVAAVTVLGIVKAEKTRSNGTD